MIGAAEMYSPGLVASASPAELTPVIRALTWWPRSLLVSTYVLADAPAMTAPSRSHSTLVDAGELRNPPLVTASVEPTVGVPVSVGLLTGSGASISAVEATIRTGRSTDVTLPASSSISACSVIVVPTCAAVGW